MPQLRDKMSRTPELQIRRRVWTVDSSAFRVNVNESVMGIWTGGGIFDCDGAQDFGLGAESDYATLSTIALGVASNGHLSALAGRFSMIRAYDGGAGVHHGPYAHLRPCAADACVTNLGLLKQSDVDVEPGVSYAHLHVPVPDHFRILDVCDDGVVS